jgi:cyclopropane-fatty-acyl-phospholipid synthase
MGSTKADVDVSYGVSNEFFRLWLDERMNYTCALFKDTKNFSDKHEDAQDNKLRLLSEYAHVGPDTQSVLDIGCGWGANLAYQDRVNKVPDVHGFTLCAEQAKFCSDRKLEHTTVTCQDYRKYEAPKLFDAAMSICMVEHVVSPENARAGKAVELYRDWFSKVHKWTKPGSYFAVQAITRNRVPRNKQDLDDLRHGTYVIFPGAVTPRVEDLIVASSPYYECMEMVSGRDHYYKTCELWRSGVRKHETEIKAKWGEQVYNDYDRYLSTCMKAFENDWQSLHRFSFRRLDK